MKTLALFASLTLAAAAASRREHTTFLLRGVDKAADVLAAFGGAHPRPRSTQSACRYRQENTILLEEAEKRLGVVFILQYDGSIIRPML